MSTIRVFLLASSLGRLIEKERGSHLVRQGFFPDQLGRSAHVQVFRRDRPPYPGLPSCCRPTRGAG